MSEAIFVEGLTKAYGRKTAVDHLRLSVKSGTVFGLLGANGAGKSTTIECILGTKRADSGTVRLLGQDPKKRRRVLFERIGVQFQEGGYQKEIRVSELCEETVSLYRSPADWHALCAQFGIGDKADAAVRSLSGGERQRLFIVLALIGKPELVFLDELTTGLDAKARRGVWKTLEAPKEQGLTIFLTSHFMDEVEALCDEICIYCTVSLATLAVTALLWGVRLHGSLPAVLGSWALTMLSTLSVGMLVGGVAKDTKQASVIASILYFPMLIFSGTTLPIEIMPKTMQTLVSVFPLTQGITMMKHTFLGISTGSVLLPVCVMVGVAALCTGLAVRFFRWE